MGAKVYQFDPDATPEAKAAQIAKAKSSVAPLPGASLKKKAADTPALAVGGEKKVAVSTNAAEAAKASAAEPDAPTTAVPGQLPTGQVSAIPEWYKIGWSGQTPQQETGLSPEEAIQSSILGNFISELYFANIFYSASVIVFAVLASHYVTRFGGGWAGLLIVMALCGKYQSLSMGRFRHRARDDITREMSKTRLFSEVETVDWMNQFMTRFWLIYEPVLSLTIVQSVDAVLSQSCPAFLDSLRLSTFTLGTKAPRIDHVRTFPDTAEDVVVMDWKVSFTPNDTADLTVRQAANKVNPKIVLAIGIGKGPAVLTKDIIVEDISFVGAMRIRLQLMNNFPHVKTVDLSFMQPPLIDFILKPIGFDIKLIPGLDHFIHSQVDANLGPMMYHPNVFTIDLEQLLSGAPLDQAIGVLQVTIHSGAQIKGVKMGGGNPDPYVSLSISHRVELARTETKPNTQNPRWGERKYLLVTTLNDTLNLAVMDFNDHRKDGELGVVSFDLKQLGTEAEHENIHGQIALQGKPRGYLKYDVRYFPVLAPKKLPDGTEEMVPETRTGIARITLHQAKELDKKRARVSQVNSFGEIHLDGQIVLTTPTLKRTVAPIWEASKELIVFSKPDAVIGIRVLDEKSGTDPQLGFLNVKLNDILEANAKQQDWFPLSSCDTGRVRLTAQWKGLQMSGAINGAGLYTPPIGVLRLFIKRGIDLKNVEGMTGGKSDPYVRIHQAGIVLARTLVVNNNLNPEWGEYIYVPVHSATNKFTLEVMDYQEKTKDRTLGKADLPIEQLLEEGDDLLRSPWKSTGRSGDRTAELATDGRKNLKGSVIYEAEFLPSANIDVSFDPPKSNLDSDTASISSYNSVQEIPETVTPLKVPTKADVKKSASVGSNVSAATAEETVATTEDKEQKPVKLEMTSEECLGSQSGVLAMHVVSGSISNPKKRGRLEIFVNSEYWPAYATEPSRSEQAKWDEVGEAFVKELDYTHILLKLNSAEKDTVDEVYADARMDLRTFLEMSMDKPGVFELTDPAGGHKSQIVISSRYVPTAVNLAPRESINNMGILSLDLIDAKDLMAADRGGKSDPYAVFELNGQKVFKSKVVKKTLNPKWHEEFETSVPSRVGAKFYVKVYDWDAVGNPDRLGDAFISLEDLEPLEPASMTLSLVHPSTRVKKGEVNIRMVFRPEFIARRRAATTTMTSHATRVGTSMSSVGKGVGGVAAGGLGAGAHVFGKGVGGLIRGKRTASHSTAAAMDDGASMHTGEGTPETEVNRVNGTLVANHAAVQAHDYAGDSANGVTGTLKFGIIRINVADADVKVYAVVSQSGKVLERAHHLAVSRHGSDTYTVSTGTGPCLLTITILDKKTFGKDRPLGSVDVDVWSHIMPSGGESSASPTIVVPDVGTVDVSLDFIAGAGNSSPASVRTSKSRLASNRFSMVGTPEKTAT